MHQLSVPILLKAKEPEKKFRDLFIGYFLVFLTYISVGIFGYMAFAGSNFKAIFQDQTQDKGIIYQNFLNMFEISDVAAILIRLLIYV